MHQSGGSTPQSFPQGLLVEPPSPLKGYARLEGRKTVPYGFEIEKLIAWLAVPFCVVVCPWSQTGSKTAPMQVLPLW